VEWNGLPRRSARHHVLLLIIPSRFAVRHLSVRHLLVLPNLCAFTLWIHHRWLPGDRPYDTELRGSVHVFKTALLVKEGTSTTVPVTLDSNQVAFSLSTLTC
jgi:hypothetical protein